MTNMLVFGHLNPDADTTCSAIAQAWFLNQQGQAAEPRVLGALNKETQYILERFGVAAPELLETLQDGDRVALVDTNNPDELPESIVRAEIAQITDHHKLVGGLSTKEQVRITMRQVACTATIIWEEMQQQGMQPEKAIAGLMLGAIISDTLNFTSPTTMPADKAAADELAVLAGVEIAEMAEAQSAAKSDLSGLSHRQILTQDSKVFPFGEIKVRISVLETTKPENAMMMQDDLKAELKTMCAEEGLQGGFFFIVDITKSSSQLMLISEWETMVAEKAFSQTAVDGFLTLPGVVSRKKQMLPALETAITSL